MNLNIYFNYVEINQFYHVCPSEMCFFVFFLLFPLEPDYELNAFKHLVSWRI